MVGDAYFQLSIFKSGEKVRAFTSNPKPGPFRIITEVVALCHFDECAAQPSESSAAIHVLILSTVAHSLLNSHPDHLRSENQTARLRVAVA